MPKIWPRRCSCRRRTVTHRCGRTREPMAGSGARPPIQRSMRCAAIAAVASARRASTRPKGHCACLASDPRIRPRSPSAVRSKRRFAPRSGSSSPRRARCYSSAMRDSATRRSRPPWTCSQHPSAPCSPGPNAVSGRNMMPEVTRFDDASIGAALDLLNPESVPDVEHALEHQLSLQHQTRIVAPRAPAWRVGMGRTLSGLAIWRRPLPAIPIAAAALFGLSLFTSPMQSLASQFLTIFRVQDFALVTVPTGAEMQSFFKALPDLSMFGDMQPSGATSVQPQRVPDLSAASTAVGFTVRAPSSLPSTVQTQPSAIRVTPAETYSFTFRSAKAQAYLASINRTDVSLPARFDGASLLF